MKIGYAGLSLPEGKVKYYDVRMNLLVDKCQPEKVTPFYVEFIPDEFIRTDGIVVAEHAVLDLLISDIERCEARLHKSEMSDEKILMKKCIEYLEQEKPLCDCPFEEPELKLLQKLGLVSIKPVTLCADGMAVNDIIALVLEKSGMIFFYTAGPREVHAWLIRKGSDIITCAGRIHTDLARGFIKGDVAAFDDFMQSHNFNDCRKKGLVKVVDRDHIIQSGDIIEIRFNV